MSFSALQLAEPIVRAVTDKGYISATEIQTAAIPPALAGRDILGTAQTGTGKTCAFALPILQRLADPKNREQNQDLNQRRPNKYGRRAQPRAARALVLCPTRELATQIHESFVDYGRNLKLNFSVIYGGVSQYHQTRSIRQGVDVLIATPGRLKDLYDQGIVDLSKIETLVLDESDRMLDMGFITDIRKLVTLIPEKHQTMLFSATISKNIRQLANDLLCDPVVIETAPEATTVDTIKQRFFKVKQEAKGQLLISLINNEQFERALIFTRTKYKADRVTQWLRRSGINADAIHSNKTQAARNNAMNDFRRGKIHVLVATDIASRGIDVDQISHVINFDMPIDPETYVHRIGRTARAGASGIAITFCEPGQKRMLQSIERRADIQLAPFEPLPELEKLAHQEDRPGQSRSSRDHREEKQRTGRRDQRDTQSRDRNSRHKKSASSFSKVGYKPRDERDGDSQQQRPFKKKFKKSYGTFAKGGYKPRDERDGDNQQQRPFKKKFKKSAGSFAKGGYKPRDERDGDSQQQRPFKKKFKKSAGSFAKGGYKPRDERDGNNQQQRPFKKKFKKNGTTQFKSGGYPKGQGKRKSMAQSS
ncbi:MAG: DEAD/DEAH box helicase [Phycisphaerales bacterium]|nr:DEAD/DEAH box helicase [Phycisphaerales bacterium]